jgi:hypothetical protein
MQGSALDIRTYNRYIPIAQSGCEEDLSKFFEI